MIGRPIERRLEVGWVLGLNSREGGRRGGDGYSLYKGAEESRFLAMKEGK